jgi:hypothetical protein
MDKITEWYESKEISFTLYKKKITDWYESKEISLTLYKKK